MRTWWMASSGLGAPPDWKRTKTASAAANTRIGLPIMPHAR